MSIETQSPQAPRVVERHKVISASAPDRNFNQLLNFDRPSDWGSPRWSYFHCSIDFEHDGVIERSHCHLWWQDCHHDATEALSQYVGMFLRIERSQPEELCDRARRADTDLWMEDWGTVPPPYYQPPNTEDYSVYDTYD